MSPFVRTICRESFHSNTSIDTLYLVMNMTCKTANDTTIAGSETQFGPVKCSIGIRIATAMCSKLI